MYFRDRASNYLNVASDDHDEGLLIPHSASPVFKTAQKTTEKCQLYDNAKTVRRRLGE